MALATQPCSGPSRLNFLKHGLLLPERNPGLFTSVFVLIVASASLLLLANALAVQPLAADLHRNTKALDGTSPLSLQFAKLIKEIQKETRELVLVSATFFAAATIVVSAVLVVTVFAAVATYSGELHSFVELLRKVKGNLKGPVVTLAFLYAIGIACVVLLAAMAALLVLLLLRRYMVLFYLVSLLLLLTCSFLVYFRVVFLVSLVVSVAEPGCCGAGAVARAWRLVKERKGEAVLFLLATGVPAAVVSLLHKLATASAVKSTACGLLVGFAYVLLMGALELFSVGAITALFYEVKEGREGPGYDQLSTDEAKPCLTDV